jgi:hypothetical protein
MHKMEVPSHLPMNAGYSRGNSIHEGQSQAVLIYVNCPGKSPFNLLLTLCCKLRDMPVDSYIPLPSRSTLSDLKLSYSTFLWNQLVSLCTSCLFWNVSLRLNVLVTARSTVCHALQMGIKHGGLQVIEEITREGQPPFSITVGQPDAKVCRDAGYRFVTVKVHDEAFWVRVYTSNDVGCGCLTLLQNTSSRQRSSF